MRLRWRRTGTIPGTIPGEVCRSVGPVHLHRALCDSSHPSDLDPFSSRLGGQATSLRLDLAQCRRRLDVPTLRHQARLLCLLKLHRSLITPTPQLFEMLLGDPVRLAVGSSGSGRLQQRLPFAYRGLYGLQLARKRKQAGAVGARAFNSSRMCASFRQCLCAAVALFFQLREIDGLMSGD